MPKPWQDAAVAASVVRTLEGVIADCPFDPAAIEAGCGRVEQLARLLLLRAFQGEGVFLEPGEHTGVADLRTQLGVVPGYERLFSVLLDLLAHDGFVDIDGGRATASRLPDTRPAACDALRDEVLAGHPDRAMLIPLVEACAPEAVAVISGRRSAVEVLFPGGSSALVENVYAKDPVSRFFNELTAHAVDTIVRPGRGERPAPASVLEIGAGTGGTSAGVLARLAPMADQVTYHYTDISPALLQGAQRAFGAHANVRFKTLDIGLDPVTQGFEAGGADVVIAANVLHATRDIATTLRHVRTLLRGGGVLVLSEVTRIYHFTTLSFGLTPGWWLFEDGGRLPDSPLLAVDGWRRALTAAGFSDVRSFTPFTSDPDRPPQTLILAACPGEEPAPAPRAPESRTDSLIWQQLRVIEAQLDLLRGKATPS